MAEQGKYFVLKQKAVPEVLLKVVEAKRLLDTGVMSNASQAAEAVGISRSSYYKYKDDIFPFHEDAKGKTLTFVLQMDDEPGVLSNVLKTIAECNANVLTIHQTIPINGVATLTMSVQVLTTSRDVTEMMEEIEARQGIHYVKILGRS